MRASAADHHLMSIWSHRAHRALPRVLVAAGRLELTDDELRFSPARTERLFGRTSWSTPLAAISAVEIEPRRPSAAMTGGLVRRLRIETTGRGVERFVVAPGLDDAVERIRVAADQARSTNATV